MVLTLLPAGLKAIDVNDRRMATSATGFVFTISFERLLKKSMYGLACSGTIFVPTSKPATTPRFRSLYASASDSPSSMSLDQLILEAAVSSLGPPIGACQTHRDFPIVRAIL